ncbi:MAG TPA: hypothetical protein VHE81_05795 [Lacipirellulaceae bacterium]|nr:hypothetical protein [Lacipirellulaceae bacterium]
MTERERWVVYPLLFLALGVSLRDKLVDRTITKSIRCEELVVEGEPTNDGPGRVLAKIGRTEATPTHPAIGYVYVNGEVKVDGLVNAKQYAIDGNLFTPIIQFVPGTAIPIPRQQGQGRLSPKAASPQSTKQSPVPKPEPQQKSAAPSSPAASETSPTK